MKVFTRVTHVLSAAVSFLFFVLISTHGYGQTTYTWVPAGGGVFTTATNWSPNGVPTTGDNLIFNIASNGTVSTVPNGITLSNVTVNGAGNVTFSSTAAATLSFSGTVRVNNGGVVKGANLTLQFNSGSTYEHNRNIGAIPIAVWDVNSNCDIIGVTTGGAITGGFSGQSLGNINYNSPSQTGILSLANALTTTVVKGSFNIINTGSASVAIGSVANTLAINGDLNISGGTFNLNSAATITTLNLAGNYNQTGGGLTKSGATSVAAFNFTGIGKTYTQSGGTVTNTLINYALNGTGASLTLNNGIIIPASRSFTVTNGTLYCGTNVISGAGSFVLANSANAILGIGSAAGITATPTATGNIQTTTRTYNLAGGYMYMGGNGQVTGAGLPVTMTGSIYVNMASASDLLTFTSTALSGNGVTVRMMVGGLFNAITYTNATNSILTYEGVAAQTVTANEFPTSTGPKTLVINNPSGVTLGSSRNVVTLNLTNGILNNGANTLTVTGTLAASVVGGSATSYVAGALARTFTSTIAASFPIGKSSYQLLTVNPTVSGNVVLTAEAFDGDAGGTGGAGVGSLNTDHYWSLAKTGTGALTSIGALLLTDAGVTSSNHVCYSSAQAGTYSISPSTVAGTIISPINPLPVPAGAANVNSTGYFVIGTGGTLSGTIPVGNSSSVQKLYQIANLLNTSTITGDVIFELQSDYDGTTGEIFPINFYQYNTSGGSWTATVRPAAGATGLLTSGNPGSGVAFVAYNGVDNLTFDGRPGGTGTNIEWILRNTQAAATYTPTLQLINDATYNTVQYVQLESQNALTSNGTVVIGTSTGTTGNDYNTIQYCNIRDRSDVTGYPANGIYAATVFNKENDHNVIYGNNVFNFWANGAEANGIYVGAYNTDWDIKSNSLYQTVTRTATSAGSITARNYGIRIASTAAGYNFNIDSNYIGGTAPLAAGSPWTQNTTATLVSTFTGIHVDANTGSTNNIRHNKISNIFWRCGNLSSAAPPGIFSGIYVLNGGANTEFNTIGGATGIDSIIITANATTGPMSFGIAHAGSSGTATVANNIVGAITANASAVSVSHSFTGIYVGQAGSSSTRYVTDNLVGSLTTPNSIHVSNASTSTTGQSLFGVSIATGANPMVVTGNTVVNLSNKYAGTAVGGQTVGMQALSGSGSFANNNVYSISSTSLSAGTGITAGVIGICYTPTVAGNTVANNKVHSISNTATTAAVNVAGLVYSGTTSGVNTVEQNFVHSLSLASSNGTAIVTGIHSVAGLTTFRNNMIRLGINELGNSVTPTCSIVGINKASTGINRIYYNSVYIGGSSGTGSSNTYAFRRTAGTTTDTLKNNIFANLRTGAGTANHFAIGFVAVTNITAANCNYNLFEVTSTGGGRVGQGVTTPYATLSDWRTGTTFDANSYFGPAGFINATGDAASVDLHINPTTPTQVEANATPVGSITNDYDGDMRTSPDIGADEGVFTAIDLTVPVIAYTPFTSACNDITTYNVTVNNITDASGVNVTPGTAPRIYYKKSTEANTYAGNTSSDNGWKYVETISTVAPYSFTIDFTKLTSPVNAADFIQYFVVAQDLATPNLPNVGINSGTLALASNTNSVDLTAAHFPTTGTPNQFAIVPCSGTVTVGTTGTYQAFTTANGIFSAINQATLSGNLTINVVSNIAIEDGVVGLNQWLESGVGGYTITIQSSSNTNRDISSVTAGYTGASLAFNGLFRINGADRVTFNGGAGNERLLTFRNRNIGSFAAVFSFTGDATNNTINNCTVEGGPVSTVNGVIYFGAGVATGNDNNTITNCSIRDLSTQTGMPTNAIFSLGSSVALANTNTITNNYIYNYFAVSGVSSGVLLSTNNTGWTISGNKFYQTLARTTHAGDQVVISVADGSSYNITDNRIGYADSIGTGIYALGNATTSRLTCIQLNTTNTLPYSTISNNNIESIQVNSSSGTSVVFTGISLVGGTAAIVNNTIGSSAATGNISISSTSNGGIVYGILIGATTASSLNISGNTIAGINVIGGTITLNTGINFYGIYFNTTGGGAINNNTIGSNTIANSIRLTSNATTSACTFNAIRAGVSASYSQVVSNNTIANLTNNSASSTASLAGVLLSSGGQYNVTGNTVSNLSTTSINTGTTSSSALIGVSLVTANTTPLSVSGNTIFNLTNNSIANSTTLGIYYSGGSNTSNAIGKNLVYNLTAGSGTASVITGIHVSTTATVSNNMVRLGYNSTGASITTTSFINGIYKDGSTASKIYFNSVYVGGSGVGTTTTSNTYAFRKGVTSTPIDSIRNNIFVNERANASTGANHFAFWSINATSIASNYNLVFAPNVSNNFPYSNNGVNYATPQAWNVATGHDLNSAMANPNFVAPTAVVADLHLGSPSPAESAGIDIATITEDIDGDVRAANTPVDMGADAAIVVQQDIYKPTIAYTAIPSQAICGTTITIVQVTISDPGTGLSLTLNKPRMYIRKSIGTPTTAWGVYPSVEGVFTSGNSNVSVWDFTVDYSLLGITVAPGDQFEYYFVAQDQASIPNVGYSQQNVTTPIHSDVATQVTPPNFVFGGSGVYGFSSPLSGTVTVGTGGTYTTFNGPSGLFNALNTRGISGNLTVEVISDINESGLYTILGPIQEYCGSGHTVVIQPNSTTVRTVYATTGGNPLISMAGCKRVTFQGQYNGVGQYLTFAQRQNMPTFYLNGVSSTATEFISVLNCTVEGNNTLTNSVGPGVINFAGLLGTGTAIRNILIDGNTIRNRSDLAQSQANIPANLISIGVSNGANLPLKSTITISNNTMFNFSNSAVLVSQNLNGNGIGDSISIAGNKIYEAFAVNTYQYPIWLESGTGKGHAIVNNKIGGNAAPNPNITGTWTNNKFDGEVVAIYTLNGGSTPNDGILISGNIISNIALNGTDYTNFIGIRNEGGGATIANNIIGSTTVANSIANYGSGNISDFTANSATIGIWNQALEDVVISNNTVANMRAYYTAGVLPYQYVQGIVHGSNQYHNSVDYMNSPGGKVKITGNSVFNLSSGSILASLNISPDALIGIFSFSENGSTGNEISGNTVYGLRVTEGWTNASNNTRLYGIGIGLGQYGSTQTGSLYNNVVYDLNNNSRANVPEINGVLIGGGNWTVYNNMVTITNSAYTAAAPMILGIGDWMTSGRTGAYYHNSVYIGGTVTSGLNSSYAFCRIPDGLGNVYGASVNIRNNIFFNDRTGGGTNNIAIGNLTQGNSADAGVGWNSNNNFIVTHNSNQVGRWVGTTAGDRSFSNWQTTSGGDANSVTATITTGNSNATQINPMELFTSLASGNLRINTSPPNSPHPYSFVRNNGSTSVVANDIDADPRDPSTPDLGCDEFTDCTTPVISLTANGLLGTSIICSSSNINLVVTSTGSGSNCGGVYEYAIASAGLYWDGSAFASATPIYNTAYSSVTFIPSGSASYTATIACSTDPTCRSNSSIVTVDVLAEVDSVYAEIGTPANGTSHYMEVSWTAVSNSTGYDVDYSNNGTTWINIAANVSTNSYSHNTGDNPNIPTYYRVRPRGQSVICGYTSMVMPVYTACDAPELPIVNGATANSVNVTLQAETPAANPTYTTYSIFCTTTNQYVQADGSLGSTEVFQTSAQWWTITVTGLLLNTNYCFYAKARNMDGDVRSSVPIVLNTEEFNSSSNFVTASDNTSKFYSPSSCTTGGLIYNTTQGCANGAIGKSSAYNNYFGCFLRTPSINCSSLSNVTLSFDITHSYFASHTNDNIRFYMFVDNSYVDASTVKINGVSVGVIQSNDMILKFDQPRNCVTVTVDFDLTGHSNLNNILFYLDPKCNYHNANLFSVFLDNISISGTPPTSCASTISCITPVITTQPVTPTAVCANSGSAMISVAAAGTSVNYQWRRNGINISNGGVYNITSTGGNSSLIITNPSLMEAGNYDVIVSGACAPNDTSAVVALIIHDSIQGLAAAVSSPVCEGGQANLNASLLGASGVSWNWSGPNNFTSNIQNPVVSDLEEHLHEGVYTVTASNACNTQIVNSNNLNIHRYIIGLVANADDVLLCEGDTLYLTANYLNAPIADVEWVWNGPDSYVDSSQFGIRMPLSTAHSGIYDVYAINACGIQSAGTPGITVDQLIEADAGDDDVLNVCGALTIQLTGNSSGVGTGSWSDLSNGQSLFTPDNSQSNATVVSDIYGLKQYRWSIVNGACISDDDVRIFFNPTINATVQLAECNFVNGDSVLVNVSASGGSSDLEILLPLGSELKLEMDSFRIYTSPMDGVQRTYTISDGICSVAKDITPPSSHPTDIPYVSASGTAIASCYDSTFNKWLTFRDASNDAIVSINDNGNNLGKVTASVYRDVVEPIITQTSLGECQGISQVAMKRHFVLKSTAPQPFANEVSVRLYFSENELNDLILASQTNDMAGVECSEYDNVTSLNDLYVTKYSGNNEDGDYMNNAPEGLYRVYTVADNSLQPSANGFPTIFTNGQNHHYVELNVTEFSELWLHGSTTGSALPVEMLYLTAKAINNEYILLDWATAIEINNNGFVIERSMDAEDWQEIGWVDGSNNSTSKQVYNYADYNVSYGVTYYYRLRQVDNDGAYDYTGVVSATIVNTISTLTIQDFIPNPALHSTKLNVLSPLVQSIQVEIYNSIAQKVISERYQLSKGSNSIGFDISGWPAGTYTAVVMAGNETFSKKLVIIK